MAKPVEFTRSFIGLGSNLCFGAQPPQAIIEQANGAISRLGRGSVVSPLYGSVAWPDPQGPEYVNAVMMVETDIPPLVLLAALQAIEAGFGRERATLSNDTARYAPRTLDLDLLAHGSLVTGSGPETELVVPHPALSERLFVLHPLADIAPDWTHPVIGRTSSEMLDRALLWDDPKSVWRLQI